ncbi:MAG: L,D-transpeptidase [Thermodesulfobacteriota bacterium]
MAHEDVRRAKPISQIARSGSVVPLLSLVLFLVPCASAVAELPQIPYPKHAEYRIAIHCSKKVLQLWRHTELIREYPADCGKGGLGKKRGGDHKTPIGDYEISWMASRAHSKGYRIRDGRSWCKDNRFVDASSGPALEKLWSESYGGLEAAVLSINYPNEKDRIRGFTGDCIHIHADKHHSDGMLKKSYGCIHLFPSDANELYEFVDVGTPVKLFP